MHRAARLAAVRPMVAHLEDARQVVQRRHAAQAAATLVARAAVAHYLSSAAILAPTAAAVAVMQKFRFARSNPIAAV